MNLSRGAARDPGTELLALVVVAIGYHHACGALLRKLERFSNLRSERWFRIFNESAVLMFTAIVILVVVKPF